MVVAHEDWLTNYMDPSGKIRVTILSLNNLQYGGYDVKFRFALSRPATGEGYIVQQVTFRKRKGTHLFVPDRILIAHFPKLTLYGFCLENAPFPEFLKVLEKDVFEPNSELTCSQINTVRRVGFWSVRGIFPEFLRVFEAPTATGLGE